MIRGWLTLTALRELRVACLLRFLQKVGLGFFSFLPPSVLLQAFVARPYAHALESLLNLAMSFVGALPKKRLYSLLNCEALR